jgi:porin
MFAPRTICSRIRTVTAPSGRLVAALGTARRLAFALCLLPLLSGRTAFADEGLANFRHLDTAAEQSAAPMVGEDSTWGPVPAEKLSLANLAPGLLPYFNNAPLFGLPGTELGGFWDRTQLTGDWGGTRTALARHGWFFDAYSTSTYQDVSSGGLKTGGAFVENIQLSMNIDTGRAGLWPGGIIHFTAQGRYGAEPQNTFTIGSYAPTVTSFVLPDPLLSHHIYPSEYYLAQAFSKHLSVVLGKISDIFIPDQTLFGNSYKYYFANFNLNKNPMTTNFYHPTALAALAVWTPTPAFALGGGVLDTETKPNTLGENAFNHVNLYLTAIMSYKLRGLPGQLSPAVNYSNKPKVDLESPYTQLSPAQIPQAVGALVGSPVTAGLPFNYKPDSWFAIMNFSQYVYVKADPAIIDGKLKSGQPLRGVGIFGRVGYAPSATNTVSRDASLALFARGLLGHRSYDSFGIGAWYNKISGDLKDSVSQLTAGGVPVNDEKGVEVFYDFALTPAIHITPSYQHQWDPLLSQVATNTRGVNVFLARLNVAF